MPFPLSNGIKAQLQSTVDYTTRLCLLPDYNVWHYSCDLKTKVSRLDSTWLQLLKVLVLLFRPGVKVLVLRQSLSSRPRPDSMARLWKTYTCIYLLNYILFIHWPMFTATDHRWTPHFTFTICIGWCL